MYYQKLVNFTEEKTNKSFFSIVQELDWWLYNLPRDKKQRFTQEDFFYSSEIPMEIISVIFKKLVKYNVFEEKFIICCQECGLCLDSAPTIIEAIEEISNLLEHDDICDFCDRKIKPTNRDIYSIYNLKKDLEVIRNTVNRSDESKTSDSSTSYGINVIEQMKNHPEFFEQKDKDAMLFEELLG